MEYEYNFYEMTTEQLQQKYKWNISEIQNKKNEISNKQLLDKVCFWINLLAGTTLGIFAIYVLFNKITIIASLLGIGILVLNGYCCIGFRIFSENAVKDLENRISQLENENIIIKEQINNR